MKLYKVIVIDGSYYGLLDHTGTAPVYRNEDGTPRVIHAEKLSREAAGRRRELRAAEERIQELEARLGT